MKDLEYKKMLTEVNAVLDSLDEELYKKLPESLTNVIKRDKDNSYDFKLDETKSINEQEMMEQTKSFLTMLYLKFWADEQEKEETLRHMKLNEEAYQLKQKKSK